MTKPAKHQGRCTPISGVLTGKDTELLAGNYQWPAARARHQGDCTPCKNHLELQKLKKKFPMPFKKEESAHTVKQEKQERND